MSEVQRAQSITELDSPVGTIGPLEPELLAAFNLAAEMVRAARTIVSSATGQLRASRWSSDGDGLRQSHVKLVTLWEAAIQREHPYRGALLGVFNPLAKASEPSSRFGQASAHVAALAVADRVQRVVWTAADPKAFLRIERGDPALIEAHFERVCLAVASEEWPDFDAMQVAIQLEAAKASVDPKPRLEFDDESRAVWLDGAAVAEGLTEDQYDFLKVVASGQGAAIRGDELAETTGEYPGKKLKRDVIEPMPPALRVLLVSARGAGGGYSLRLPPPPRKPRPRG